MVLAGDTVMKLKVVLETSEEGGYTAFVPSLPGCISEGDTREQALTNIKEAIELYLEPVEDDSDFAPTAEIVEVAL
jgi:predicted RNase H-like HicB family nuclease